ncbi:MAG TPA: hypothetical protein VH062_33750 [Polyangiaceae bacterium]|jgi:hypothetical protein|nr:hypothetical protein [Polyangiaceae bacterium]
MNDVPAPVRQRFPLFVGTRSYRTIATGPSWLLFAASTTLTILVLTTVVESAALVTGARVLSLFALLLCVSPVALLAQLGWVVGHVVDATSTRACDVELGDGKLRVIGGSGHGFEATFDELALTGAIELTASYLTLKRRQGRPLTLRVPADPDERASLEALHASLEAAALGRAAKHAVSTTSIAVLCCTGCGAPLSPARTPTLRCAFCGTETTTTPEVVAKLESAALVDEQRRADEALCTALRRQPGPRVANVVAFGGGALMLALTVPAVLFAAMLGFVLDDPAYLSKWRGVGLIASGASLCLLAFVRERLANRTALRVLTLGFAALPPDRAGAPARCRSCGGALPTASVARVLIQCVYCDAENLTSLDLGFDADLVRRFSAGERSPARALEKARAKRLGSRLFATVGCLLIVAGVVWRLS